MSVALSCFAQVSSKNALEHGVVVSDQLVVGFRFNYSKSVIKQGKLGKPNPPKGLQFPIFWVPSRSIDAVPKPAPYHQSFFWSWEQLATIDLISSPLKPISWRKWS